MAPASVKLGWGLLSPFSPFRYIPNFSVLSKHTLDIEYHGNVWQVSLQLSCGDTCQIWMWFKESKRYFCKFENFAYGEIDERSLSNPHPWSIALKWCYILVLRDNDSVAYYIIWAGRPVVFTVTNNNTSQSHMSTNASVSSSGNALDCRPPDRSIAIHLVCERVSGSPGLD